MLLVWIFRKKFADAPWIVEGLISFFLATAGALLFLSTGWKLQQHVALDSHNLCLCSHAAGIIGYVFENQSALNIHRGTIKMPGE